MCFEFSRFAVNGRALRRRAQRLFVLPHSRGQLILKRLCTRLARTCFDRLTFAFDTELARKLLRQHLTEHVHVRRRALGLHVRAPLGGHAIIGHARN